MSFLSICNVSEPKIGETLHNLNIRISSGSISNILIKKKDIFHQEKEDIVAAGLLSTPYQQIDDTGARVDGQNYHTYILCNPWYTAYFTTEKKDRLTIIEILQNGSELKYCLNQEAVDIAEQLGVALKYIQPLKQLQSGQAYQKQPFIERITKGIPGVKDYALAVYWEYYRKLLAYKIAPSQEASSELSIEFDRVSKAFKLPSLAQSIRDKTIPSSPGMLSGP